MKIALRTGVLGCALLLGVLLSGCPATAPTLMTGSSSANGGSAVRPPSVTVGAPAEALPPPPPPAAPAPMPKAVPKPAPNPAPSPVPAAPQAAPPGPPAAMGAGPAPKRPLPRRVTAAQTSVDAALEELERNPPAAGPAPSDFDRTDAALGAARKGTVAFNLPERIAVNQTAPVQLRLSLQAAVEELKARIDAAAPGRRDSAEVLVMPRMEAKLSGDPAQVRIVAIAPEVQAVSSRLDTSWTWDVTALTPGRHSLHLTLNAVLDGGDRRSVQTFDRIIEVDAGLGYWISGFVQKNWQWLWSAILIPLAGLGWKKWRSRGPEAA